MPTKNGVPDLNASTLYIETPEGLEPFATGGIMHAAEILPLGSDYSHETVIPLTTPGEVSFKIDMVWHAAIAAGACVRWAIRNRRRLAHLAIRAKKHRTRKKNVKRIISEYIKEG